MREYEFAIYAYKFVLFRTYNAGFDQAIVRQIAMCLKALGMERVIPFLDQFLVEIERIIIADHKRQQESQPLITGV